MSDAIAAAVIGCGRMGRLHARSYAQIPGTKLVGVCDNNHGVAEAVASEYGCEAFDDPYELLDRAKAVSIAVPTQAHLEVAEPFLRKGVACLIEKPLARDIAEGQRIVDLAKECGALVQVGHIERFNPAVRAVQRLGIQPRFIEVVRVSPMTFRSIDVGVVLDMMIHDIDIVLKLANSTVSRIDATGVSVIGNVEDICNARLVFANGCVANVTASRLAMKTERKLRIFSRDAYVSVDYQKRHGVVVRRQGNLDSIRDAAERLRAGEIGASGQPAYSDLVKLEELPVNDVDPIRAEVESFISAVRTGSTPAVSAEEGLAAVGIARRIVDAIGELNSLG